ncbi:hypothetical protein [Paenibacillus taichungensis]
MKEYGQLQEPEQLNQVIFYQKEYDSEIFTKPRKFEQEQELPRNVLFIQL